MLNNVFLSSFCVGFFTCDTTSVAAFFPAAVVPAAVVPATVVPAAVVFDF